MENDSELAISILRKQLDEVNFELITTRIALAREQKTVLALHSQLESLKLDKEETEK